MKSRNLKAKVHELRGMYTVRMIAAVMLIQITTCVLALAFSILVLRQGTREIRENGKSTLEVYGNLADVNLKRAQAQINSFAFDSLEVAALNSHPDGTEKDYYRAISHVAKLSTIWKIWSHPIPGSALFTAISQKGICLYARKTAEATQTTRTQLMPLWRRRQRRRQAATARNGPVS